MPIDDDAAAEIERRVNLTNEMKGINDKLDYLTERTIKIDVSLHGEGKECGFIGETQKALAIHSLNIKWLWACAATIMLAGVATYFK